MTDSLMSDTVSIIESIMVTMSSSLARITSMALRASGVTPSEGSRSSMEFPIAPSIWNYELVGCNWKHKLSVAANLCFQSHTYTL